MVADTVEQPQWILIPRSMLVLEVFELLLRPQVRGEAQPATWKPADLRYFDWSGRPLPGDTDVASVPLPGVVIGALPAGKASQLIKGSAENNIWLFRQTLLRDKTSADRLRRYLSSPDATVDGTPVKQIDVFVSYSFTDGALAERIVRELQGRGLDVFLAESSLNTGRQWRDQVRDAVLSSRTGILLVTRNSLHSTWVLAEAGAFASQRTPTLVLLEGVAESEVPTPVRHAAATIPAENTDSWLAQIQSMLASRTRVAK